MGVIYLIKNKVNNKCYIGIDRTNYQRRWKDHIRHSKKDAIQLVDRKIAQYGINNFKYREIYVSNDIDVLKKKEMYFIKRHKTFVTLGKGYNRTLGGDGCEGFKMPIDKIHKGKDHYKFGKHWNKKEKMQRSISMKGKNKGKLNGAKKKSARDKISSKAKLRVGELNPNYRHGRRVNGKKIRINAQNRYIKNRVKELLRAKAYRKTHIKIKGRWYLRCIV